MASDLELRTWQKTILYDLLKLKRDNPNLRIVGLNEMLRRQIAVMDADDVARVEKEIAELDQE